MAVNWIATLQEQADLVIDVAKDVAKDVTNTLDASDLTVEQASRLYRMIESGTQDFDRIVELINGHDLQERFIDAAEITEGTWTNLSIATANRVRVLRGLDPIGIAPDDRNEA